VPRQQGESGDLSQWKAKFGGMNVSEAKRLKQLEDENAKLQRPAEARFCESSSAISPEKAQLLAA
jgi:hypothetical protein